AAAVLLSIVLATPRIAVASGLAFLVAQLLDVTVFDRMRQRAWWQAPLVSSMLGSAVDTALFFSIAFYGTDVPWVTLGIGDFLWKVAFALAMLVPFRLLMPMTAGRAAQ
ncbi:MAG: queuosine precursor transporter, partial [Alphaproteobacteria bacterium]|nr:queuosine precursor transporter [Alphaproteobacteria bacterium]